jgi:hypothetical protein
MCRRHGVAVWHLLLPLVVFSFQRTAASVEAVGGTNETPEAGPVGGLGPAPRKEPSRRLVRSGKER